MQSDSAPLTGSAQGAPLCAAFWRCTRWQDAVVTVRFEAGVFENPDDPDHAMVSLLAELQISLRATIAAARDQDHTWHDIARQLQITPATARRRYRETRTSDTADSHVNIAGPR
jgi:hypothetical protein